MVRRWLRIAYQGEPPSEGRDLFGAELALIGPNHNLARSKKIPTIAVRSRPTQRPLSSARRADRGLWRRGPHSITLAA